VDTLLKGLIHRVELIPDIGRGLLQQVVGDVDILVGLDALGHRALDVVLGEAGPTLGIGDGVVDVLDAEVEVEAAAGSGHVVGGAVEGEGAELVARVHLELVEGGAVQRVLRGQPLQHVAQLGLRVLDHVDLADQLPLHVVVHHVDALPLLTLVQVLLRHLRHILRELQYFGTFLLLLKYYFIILFSC